MDEEDFESSFMDLVERITGRRLESEVFDKEHIQTIVAKIEYLNALEIIRTSAQTRYIKALGTLGFASSVVLGILGTLTIAWSVYFWLK